VTNTTLQYVVLVGAMITALISVVGLTLIAISNPATVTAIIPILAAFIGALATAASSITSHVVSGFFELQRIKIGSEPNGNAPH
jgi:hypothetical protein